MTTSASIREPLVPTTNHSASPPPSPPQSIHKAAIAEPAEQPRTESDPKVPSLRRKTTIQNLINLDSSESFPSHHSSLYDASVEIGPLRSEEDEDKWIYDNEKAEKPSWANTICNNDGNPVPSSFLQPIPLPKEHTPHKLYPITEQSSFASLQFSFRTNSLNDRPSHLSLHSRRSRSPGLNGMRQKSFSLSDLSHGPTTDVLPTAEPSPPATFHPPPHPNRPHRLPPFRSITPPNLPRFGTPEACNYRLPRPTLTANSNPTPINNKKSLPTKSKKPSKMKQKNHTHLSSSNPQIREWRRQTVSLPRNVIMRGSDGTLVRGKFEAGQSGHNGPVRMGGWNGGMGMGLGPYVRASVGGGGVERRETEREGVQDDALLVMTGGIGVAAGAVVEFGSGPGPGPGVEVEDWGDVIVPVPLVGEAQRERMRRRKRWEEGFGAWKGFFGVGGMGMVMRRERRRSEERMSSNSVGGDGGDRCVCSWVMWRCCLTSDSIEDVDGEEAGPAAVVVPL